MKVRSGFVSNSSSSSFVVRYRDERSKELLISEQQIQQLEELGFWYSDTRLPTFLNHYRAEELEADNNQDTVSLVYAVICNQDDVVTDLIEVGVPFSASCHYGHYNLFWDGKSDLI